MPLDRFVLIVIVVIVAAGVTVWLAALLAGAIAVPGMWLALIPTMLVGFVLWRVIAERLRNRSDDHYDKIEK